LRQYWIWKRRLPGAFYKAPSQIAIGIRNPVKKVRISENLINTKKSMNIIHERTQIKIEFLKDACYRIYFTHTDKQIYERLKESLKEHRTVYTISMDLVKILRTILLPENLTDVK